MRGIGEVEWGTYLAMVNLNHKGTPKVRFLSYVQKTKTCWIWKGAKDRDGYGQFYFRRRKSLKVHRYSFILSGKTLPKYHPGKSGLVLDHLCKVKSCVNPDHLEVVTNVENHRRRRKPFCKRRHPEIEKNRYVDGYPRCLLCKRIRAKKARLKKKKEAA